MSLAALMPINYTCKMRIGRKNHHERMDLDAAAQATGLDMICALAPTYEEQAVMVGDSRP